MRQTQHTRGYQAFLGRQESVWMWAMFIHTTILRPVHRNVSEEHHGRHSPQEAQAWHAGSSQRHIPDWATVPSGYAWLVDYRLIASTAHHPKHSYQLLKICNPKNYVEVEYSVEREHSLLNTAWNYQKSTSLFQERISYILSTRTQFLFWNPNYIASKICLLRIKGGSWEGLETTVKSFNC